MSLLRQLFVSIAIVTTLLLIGAQAVSIDTARRYLNQDLHARAENIAAALASIYTRDPAPAGDAWRAMAQDIFSSGAYRLIKVDGDLAFEYRKNVSSSPAPTWFTSVSTAPAWFASLISLAPDAATKPFRSQRGLQGSITVAADDSAALQALWRHSIGLAALIVLAGLCWLIYARELVRWLQTRMLHRISAQVRALAGGEPEPAPLPKWREMADVANALAEARERFRMRTEEINARIESLQLELNLDPVTRLPNRKYFFNELRRALNSGSPESNAEAGHILMFRQRDLAAINRHMPRDFTDQWLRSVGLRLDQKFGRRQVPILFGAEPPQAKNGPLGEQQTDLSVQRGGNNTVLARLNGSDFALLLNGVPAAQADALADTLRQELRALRVSLDERHWCRWALAIVSYSRGARASKLLALLDHALMQAESADTDAPVRAQAPGISEAAGELQWRDTLVMALEQHRFSLAIQSLQGQDGQTLHDEVRLMLHDAEAQAPIPAHVFMPAAIRLGLSAECDIQATRLALDWLVSHAGQLAVAVAVPSLGQANFLPRLSQMLRDRPTQAARLVLEIEARGLVENFANVRGLCEVVGNAGARIGVRRLADDFSAITRLHELPIAYVKLGADFIDDMARSPGSRHLAASVRDTVKGLGVEVYADGLPDDPTRAYLEDIGIVPVRHTTEAIMV